MTSICGIRALWKKIKQTFLEPSIICDFESHLFQLKFKITRIAIHLKIKNHALSHIPIVVEFFACG
jgi:hypothetical protein